jgi:hypothetical protein
LLGVGRVLGWNYSIEVQSSSDRRLGSDDGSPSHSWQHSLTTTKIVLAVLKFLGFGHGLVVLEGFDMFLQYRGNFEPTILKTSSLLF